MFWLWIALLPAALAAVCDNSTFPVDLTNYQVIGLRQVQASSAAACQQACCDDSNCDLYQYAVAGGQAYPVGSCWIGKDGHRDYQTGWISRGRNVPPAPPPPTPPPLGPYDIDDSKGLGLRFEGIGAISGGGATSKLLMEYPPEAVSDILDYLFLPNFGLGLQILKVELGGDTDATEGAEPSHMHYHGDEDYNRGYEWWLMKEAKKRNPDIKLYGLPWGWPGWLDPSATPDQPAKNAFADPQLTANYTLAWILGAKRVHNLDIDYIGQWNERDAPADYAAALRKVVGEQSPSTTVLNRIVHYPGTGLEPDAQRCQQYAWNLTDGSRWVDEEGSVADGQSARCLARCASRAYISDCHTAMFQWHLISSFYDYLPWARCGVAVANTPWSGSYEITSPTWALAHTTQFADIGWRFARHDGGVGFLSKGGSYVTRVAPGSTDMSIVVEKMTHDSSNCARGNNPGYNTAAENVTFILKGSFANVTSLNVWYSNLTDGNDSSQLFIKKGPIPVTNGRVTISVAPGDIFTLTTLTRGNKGSHTPPGPSTFPLPYTQNFDDETVPAPPRIWYDQMGAWQVYPDPRGSGNVMRQMVPVWPECWGYSCTGPTSYFGPASFNTSLQISFETMLEDHAKLSLTLYKDGPTITLDTTGHWSIGSSGGSASFTTNTWHTVEIETSSTTCKLVLDGATLGTASISLKNGFSLQLQLSRYIFANIDNFKLANA